MTNNQAMIDRYRQQNLEAARIIVADPVKYVGIMLEWARLTLELNKLAVPGEQWAHDGRCADWSMV